MTICPVASSRCALVVSLVFVVAVQQGISQAVEGDVRLVGANHTVLQGRVEVFHDGEWVSVCVAPWDTRKGDVICRQLEFSGGAMSTDSSALYGEGTSSSWLTAVTCTGNEERLSDCSGLTYGTGTCSHANDAGVRCTYPMYQGCYAASSTGPLTSFSTVSQTMTIARCLQTCLGRGLTYAGVWEGTKCSCGDTISSATKQGNSACRTACLGDPSEICGGGSAMSIYRTQNIYEGAEDGYVTSSRFPSPYTPGDSVDHTVAIPAEFDYTVVSFVYFKLAPGDTVRLTAVGSPTGNYPGSDSTDVPEFWVSMSGATSFQVSFTVAAGSPGNTGFALKYEFGRLCNRNALPGSVADGSYSAGQTTYSYGQKVMVTCYTGYQSDPDSFVCLSDGSWSPAPICSPIPTMLAPSPTTLESETTESDGQATAGGEATQYGTQGTNAVVPSVTPEGAFCTVPTVTQGTITPSRPTVLENENISLTCNDSYTPSGGNTVATCQPSGEFDVVLACSASVGLPAWLITIIAVAGVLAIIVVVLIILIIAVNSDSKPPPRYQGPRRDDGSLPRESSLEDRLVPIAPSVHQGGPSATQSVASLDLEESGMVNQGAQTDADPSLGDLGDPMVNENDVHHPQRDYPGAGAGTATAISSAGTGVTAGTQTDNDVTPSGNGSTTPGSHAGRPPRLPSMRSPPVSPPPNSPFQRPLDYRPGAADFSMLANEELLAVRALDNVVSDFERVDQAFFLGPSGPSPYNMDRGSRYGSRQIQYPQRSRSSFYALY